MAGKCILVLGGARSGKSRHAQEAAARSGERILFVATAEALDEEMRCRIEEHRRSRPSSWRTVEAPTGVGRRIREEIGDAEAVIVDCVTLLVANVISRCGGDRERVDAGVAEERVTTEIDGLVECINETDAVFILVSNEVGAGLVPDNELGRFYRDLLGKTNQTLATHATEVRFMVAGIPLKLSRCPE